MRYFERMRQNWLRNRKEPFNRADLAKAFGISIPQASKDITKFLTENPHTWAYNKKRKIYERSENTAKDRLIKKLTDTSDGYELVDFKFSLPITKAPIVYVHIGTDDIPVYYSNNAEIIVIDENAPHDRVFQVSRTPVPQELLDSIKDEYIGHGQDARQKKLEAEMFGQSHLREV